MSLTKLITNLDNVQGLDNQPNASQGYTPAQVKAIFDKAGNDIKSYINETLTEEIPAQYATNEALSQVIAGQVNIIDPVTGKKYVYVVINGEPGIQEVL